MDTWIYGSISLLSLLGIYKAHSNINNLFNQIKAIREERVFTPSTLHLLESVYSELCPNAIEEIGKYFIEGFCDTKIPIVSSNGKDEKTKLIYSLMFLQPLFSNDKYKAPWEKISQVPNKGKKIEMCPFFYLNDLEKNSKIKIMKNLSVEPIEILSHIVSQRKLNALNIIEKIFWLFGLFLDLLGSISRTEIKFRGVRVGTILNVFGIKLKTILTAYGFVKFNKKTKELIIEKVEFLLKDKSFLISKYINRIINTKIMLAFFYMIFTVNGILLIRKLKIIYNDYVKKKEEAKLDKLRNIKTIQIEEYKCPICQEHTRNVILKPCKHLCLCKKCYNSLQRKECPICKKAITDYIEIFVC